MNKKQFKQIESRAKKLINSVDNILLECELRDTKRIEEYKKKSQYNFNKLMEVLNS